MVSVYPKRGIDCCYLWVHCCLPLVVRVSVIVRSSARVSVCVGPRVSLTSENCVIIKNLVSESALFFVSPFWLFD